MKVQFPSERLCYNANEVMAKLSIGPSTLYKLCKTQKLVPVSTINERRHRLFRVQDVLDLLKKK